MAASSSIEPVHLSQNGDSLDFRERSSKRAKLEDDSLLLMASVEAKSGKEIRGYATVKEEFLVRAPAKANSANDGPETDRNMIDDDAAEAGTLNGIEPHGKKGRDKKAKRAKTRGQNQKREFGRSADAMPLCNSRVWSNEFSPKDCKHQDKCQKLHDLRKYLKEGRRADLEVFGGKCPVFKAHGKCFAGWRCRFVSSHMKEVERADGRKELVLVEDPERIEHAPEKVDGQAEDRSPDIVNNVDQQSKYDLQRNKVAWDKADKYTKWVNKETAWSKRFFNAKKENQDALKDFGASYVDPPFKPSEKRRLYFGQETPVLAPLTTQGNLPFRRLCVELGAQATYSEMALGMALIQGAKADWALLRAHKSEMAPPKFEAGKHVIRGYDNTRDLKFGAQITAHTYSVAYKATEALSRFVPHLRVIDLNCGCPIDMVYKSGAGSALLDAPGKLERMLRGMNAVSGETPVSAKIRIGVRDDKPNAVKLVERLCLGGFETRGIVGAPGCAAVTLHGRSRQQRYTKKADWGYISDCAALIHSYRAKRDEVADTIREPDANTLPGGGEVYFLGNGDCFSHTDYFSHLDKARVDSVMIGRGAIIKPWIFEEIEKGQYLDKSATERLAYVEKFARYGLETWGSDEVGVGLTRRFLLEFLSFFHRYIPLAVLEHLPPRINERPPKYRGRNELEMLLASDNYKDWIKISEMFLGPAHPNFKFLPKHKSNSYEIEAEG